jgi:hypothetical protein
MFSGHDDDEHEDRVSGTMHDVVDAEEITA